MIPGTGRRRSVRPERSRRIERLVVVMASSPADSRVVTIRSIRP